MFKDVCRLCLGTNNLLWVFDEKICDNMTHIIKVTSGVEILKTDCITQMVCSTCCQITLKMYRFQTTSIKNNSDLKAQYAVYNISQLTSAHKKNDIVCHSKEESVILESNREAVVPESPEKDIVPESPEEYIVPDSTNENEEDNVSPESKKSHSICESEQEPAAATKPLLPPLQLVITPMPDIYNNAHPSIKELIRTNPNLKIPKDCLNSHVGAYITLLADEVDKWYKERNYTDEEIAALKKGACQVALKKRKKTEKAETADPTPQKKVKSEKKEERQFNKFIRKKVISEFVEQTKVSLGTETKDKTPESVKLCDERRSSVSSDSIKSSNKTNTPESEEEITLTSILRSKPRARRILSSDDECGGGADDGPPSPQLSDSEDEHVETPANESTNKDSREERVETLSKESSKMPSKESTSKDAKEEPKAPPKDKDATEPKNPREERVETLSKENSKDAREERVETPSKESTSKDAKEKANAPPKDKDATEPKNHSKNGTLPFPDEDLEMFTSRPFIRKPQYKVCDNVLLIVSDSEDEQQPKKATSTNSDPIVLDFDSRSSFGDSNKALFTEEALELVPVDSSNTPNPSLLAVANKTRTLYPCRVCDSQHQNLWELKQHMRKRHTKCPFCSKRFKTLALRNDHVKNDCGVNKSPIKLKIAKLELVRVDEDEEIRKKYPKAFGNGGGDDDDVTSEIRDMEVDNTTEAPKVPEVTEDKNKEPNAPQVGSTIQYDTETERAVLEIEKFLSYTENVPSKRKTKKKKKNEDFICISDEEPESTTKKDDCTPKIKIVGSEILKHINMNTTDFEVLKTILVNQSNIRATLGRKSYEAIARNPILNGSTNRMKIFKKLHYYLKQYKIPIQVKYSPEVSVSYLPPKIRKLKKKPDLWSWITPKEIKPVGSNAQKLRTLLTGQTVSYVAQPSQSTPAQNLGSLGKTVSYVAQPSQSTPAQNLGSLGKTVSYVVQPPQSTPAQNLGSLGKTVSYVAQPSQSTPAQNLDSLGKTVSYVAQPSQSTPAQNVGSLLASKTVSYVAQPPQSTPVFYDGNVRQSVVPTNFSTNSLVSASSSSLVTTNTSLVLNGSPCTSTPPIILNGTHAITSNSGYTNLYLVPSALTALTPPQGHLPVIQSVSSAVDVSNEQQPSASMIATLESISNSLMPLHRTSNSFVPVSQPNNNSFVPATQSNNLFVPVSHASYANAEQQGNSTDQPSFRQQPTIRVKNLKELS